MSDFIRPRRLRENPLLREMLSETHLSTKDFVAPIFVCEGKGVRVEVESMPGVYRYSVDMAVAELKRLAGLGVGSYLLFGVTADGKKDAFGSYAHDPENEVCRAIKAAKDAGISMVAITDLCYCEYTSHGHCGVLKGPEEEGDVDNDQTILRLGEQAVIHARAGADVVAPSGMMDHMVRAIRKALDGAGFLDKAILSYAVKYASAFYGPFRDAVGTPAGFRQKGTGQDRKGYQMDYRGGEAEALREASMDVEEGADMLMVKPGMPYLDILRAVSAAVPVPTGAYQVSGEYAMIKAAAAKGWIEEKGVVLETMHGLKRAGARFIVSYYAGRVAEWVG